MRQKSKDQNGCSAAFSGLTARPYSRSAFAPRLCGALRPRLARASLFSVVGLASAGRGAPAGIGSGGSGGRWRALLALLAAGGSGWRLAAGAPAEPPAERPAASRARQRPGFPCRRACRFLVFCGFPTTFALQNRALFVQKGGAGRIAGPTSKGPRPPHARNAEGFEWGVS